MELDPVLLSRVQFAWIIAWHILLPALTVGLASFIAVQEGLRLATWRDVYVRISTFWIKIVSIAFGIGVVTGVVMPFQFGMSWSRFYPMIVPHHFTLWQAASSERTQAFLLVETLVLLPVILMYTGWSILGVPRQRSSRHRLPVRFAPVTAKAER